jgi:hypothetical protein
MRRFPARALTILLFLATAECALADQIRVAFLRPPLEFDRVHGVGERLERIAVFDPAVEGAPAFRNRSPGVYLANRLIETMQDPDFGLVTSRVVNPLQTAASAIGLGSDPRGGGTFQPAIRAIEFVERKNLQLASEEFKLSAGQLITEETAPRIGEMVGCDALAHGSVTGVQSEVPQSCESTDAKGRRTMTRGCTRTVEVTAFLSLFEASQSRIRYSRTVPMSASDTNCDCRQTKGFDELTREALDRAALVFAADLVPYYREEEIELKELDKSPKKKASERVIEEMKRIVTHAPSGRFRLDPCELAEARSFFAGAVAEDGYLHEAQYMLGVVSELQNDFDGALTCYRNAAETIDEKRYREAVTRAKTRIEDRDRLSTLGVSLPIADCADPAIAGSARTIRIDRDEARIFRSPDVSGDVLRTLRKDIRLKVLGRSGDFYQVELLGGETGYVLAAETKPLD